MWTRRGPCSAVRAATSVRTSHRPGAPIEKRPIRAAVPPGGSGHALRVAYAADASWESGSGRLARSRAVRAICAAGLVGRREDARNQLSGRRLLRLRVGPSRDARAAGRNRGRRELPLFADAVGPVRQDRARLERDGRSSDRCTWRSERRERRTRARTKAGSTPSGTARIRRPKDEPFTFVETKGAGHLVASPCRRRGRSLVPCRGSSRATTRPSSTASPR